MPSRGMLPSASGLVVPEGAWQTFSPTLWENATVAATLNYAAWVQIGRFVHAKFHFTATATGTANAAGIQVRYTATEIPVPAYTANPLSLGAGDYQISSGAFHTLHVVQATATAFGFYRDGFNFTYGSSSNGAGGNTAIGVGDKIRGHVVYETT